MSLLFLPADSSIVGQVSDAEYARLLGWPRARRFGADLQGVAREARDWYVRHGRPFAAAARTGVERIEQAAVELSGGAVLRGAAIAERLRSAQVRTLAVVAASAGREVDEETARLWSLDRPDAAFFLDRLGAAVAEQLVRAMSMGVCRAAGTERLTALPPLAPGCGGWDLADQSVLYGVFGNMAGPLSMLDSGMLRPKSSILAVVGLTPHSPHDPHPPHLVCRACDLTPCAFRRAPYDRPHGRIAWPASIEATP